MGSEDEYLQAGLFFSKVAAHAANFRWWAFTLHFEATDSVLVTVTVPFNLANECCSM